MSASILSRTLEFISRDRHTRAVLSVLFTFTIIASGSLLALYAISPRIHVNLSVEVVSVEGSAFQVAVEPRAHFPFYFTAADRSHNRTISKLELTEDARPLSPPHGLLEDISERGRGRYFHGLDDSGEQKILFSASDNSDPRKNGRVYAATGPVDFRLRVIAPLYAGLVAGIFGLLFIHREFVSNTRVRR